jgi:nitrate reductase NapAB chaperone NapD
MVHQNWYRISFTLLKNSNSLSPIDGISVAVKSAKGKIIVSESDTWLEKMIGTLCHIS